MQIEIEPPANKKKKKTSQQSAVNEVDNVILQAKAVVSAIIS